MPKLFFHYSRKLGALPAFVQGAGGNISWKNGGTMLVKASGYFLKDVRRGVGYVTCRLRPLVGYLSKIRQRPRSLQQEDEFSVFIENHLIAEESFGVPSIETGMHAVLGRAAIHTHNVYANVFCSIRGGEKVLRALFPESVCMPYLNPGLAVACALTLKK